MVRTYRIAVPLLLLGALLPFQNCSETLPEKTAVAETDNSSVVPSDFALAVAPDKATVLPGAALRFSSTVTPTSTSSGATFKITVRHPNQSVIWTENKPVPAGNAGQTTNVSFDFAVPETLPAATYAVSAQLLSADQSQVLKTANNLSSFAVQGPVRVNVGSPTAFTDAEGRVWAADFGFTGQGTIANETHPATVNSPDQPLWENFRWGAGSFAFTTAVPSAGKYKVTLRWTEHYVFGPNLRRFNVDINGQRVLTEFDLFTEAGGAYRAYDRSFIVNAVTPSIRVDFTHGSIENPKISAIEILGAP